MIGRVLLYETKRLNIWIFIWVFLYKAIDIDIGMFLVGLKYKSNQQGEYLWKQ